MAMGALILIWMGLLLGAHGLQGKPCPAPCTCGEGPSAGKVDCRALNLTSAPYEGIEINTDVLVLDLGQNNISVLTEASFSRFPNLQELTLSENRLRRIHPGAFKGLTFIRVLSLADNLLDEFPLEALRPLHTLETLRLNGNRLRSIGGDCLSPLEHLRRLWLDNNWLDEVPQEALNTRPNLEALNLAQNRIRILRNGAFQNLTQLMILVLKQNLIERVEDDAFLGLEALKVLEINSNKLQVLPLSLSHLTSLKELSFATNSIRELSDSAFSFNRQLAVVEMAGNPLSSVGTSTFAQLPALKTLTLSEVRHLWEFPDLTGTQALEHLRLDRGGLRAVPPDLCLEAPHLKSLNLKSNKIEELPNITACSQLRLVDLSFNQLRTLSGSPFRFQTKLIDLFLSNNLLEVAPEDAFTGLESLHVLDLHSNKISKIHPEAFVPMKELRDLNLGYNQFSWLPSKGLQNLRHLKTFGNPNLKEFPPPESFPRIHSLTLSYAYHCCAFLPMVHRPTAKPASMQETIVWLHKDQVDLSVWNTNFTDSWPGYENFSSKFEEFANDWWHSFGRDYTLPDNIAQYAEEYFEDYKPAYNSEEALLSRYPIHCLPEPGPFMPCEDLFGWWTLRCGVWVVFLLALLGNGVVVVVLMFGRSKMDVPRFLVCNLAMADFFMGVYLGILAVVDASTLGEFKVYAIQWQFSAGCQIAGFLGVLSTELSVYTLSVITLERNYAITHAMHLNKRLSLKHAGYIMSTAWIFALVMSFLPLFGVSDYRKFAVCLPFEVHDAGSLAYVIFLILINGVAFLILMGCYLKMYCAIRGSQAWNSNDSRIAKRMALLVFTDFVCWAPIAFFALTAVFGLQLISLEEAKVFTIFVLPLNSCANPFLYAIFTKQFKKDCVLICKRIEESRVTRGIGRCRHSSNFSNRHTPANTNSAADRKSGSEPTACHCSTAKLEPNRTLLRSRRGWKTLALRYLLCRDRSNSERGGGGHHHNLGTSSSASEYAYALSQIQKGLGGDHKPHSSRNHKRASSISSENFSSRSDSWRQGHVPLRLLERAAHRRNSWSVTRKQSQDSNLSCSRQDSSTSTYRMSRSSVSSNDNAGNSVGGVTTRVGASARNNTTSASTSNPVTTSGNTSVMARNLLSSSVKDKPKLCRQSAVDEGRSGMAAAAALQQHSQGAGRGMTSGLEMRPFTPRSPPSLMGRPVELCPACARKEASPPLTFKSKEMEEKFTCFYNRLAETSHEESSEVSKDDPVLLSTSSADQKDSKGTHESTLSTGDERGPSPPPRQPPPIQTTKPPDPVLLSLRPSGLSHLLHSSDDALQSVAIGSTSAEPRKCRSQTSIQKLSLKNLPAALLSSFSAVAPRLKVRSHTQLRPSSVERLPTSRSETTLTPQQHSHSQECVHADWSKAPRGRSFAASSLAEDADSSSSEVDDVFIHTRRAGKGEMSLLNPEGRKSEGEKTSRPSTSEDAPLIGGDLG